MGKKVEVSYRIKPELKAEVEAILKSQNIGHSEAIMLFFEEVQKLGRLPFPVSNNFENKPVNPSQKQRAN